MPITIDELKAAADPLCEFVRPTGDGIEFTGNEALDRLRRADVIYGHNTADDSILLFFGLAFFKSIVAKGAGQHCIITVIRYDGSELTDELEQLCSAIEGVKGWCDYGMDGQCRDGLDGLCDQLFNGDQ